MQCRINAVRQFGVHAIADLGMEALHTDTSWVLFDPKTVKSQIQGGIYSVKPMSPG